MPVFQHNSSTLLPLTSLKTKERTASLNPHFHAIWQTGQMPSMQGCGQHGQTRPAHIMREDHQITACKFQGIGSEGKKYGYYPVPCNK